MPHASPRIHSSALIGPEVDLAADVEVGPQAILEGPIRLGPGCVVRARAHLIGPLTVGDANDIGIGVVLGERPQHLHDGGEASQICIGNHNIFREYVTVHRGTAATGLTRVGDHNFLMVGSHVGHDGRVGNHCILANHALLGGHVELGDRAMISGNAAVHQFSRVGRLALVSGISGVSKDAVPFMIHQGFNTVMGVNVIGMRRAGHKPEAINAMRRAYQILFRQANTLQVALTKLEQELGTLAEVQELIAFIRASTRGICGSQKAGGDTLEVMAA